MRRVMETTPSLPKHCLECLECRLECSQCSWSLQCCSKSRGESLGGRSVVSRPVQRVQCSWPGASCADLSPEGRVSGSFSCKPPRAARSGAAYSPGRVLSAASGCRWLSLPPSILLPAIMFPRAHILLHRTRRTATPRPGIMLIVRSFRRSDAYVRKHRVKNANGTRWEEKAGCGRGLSVF